MSVHSTSVSGVRIDGPHHPGQDQVLTPEAVEFLADLHRRFNPRRLELLAARAERQKRTDAGERPDFLPETKHIRESEWTVAPIPADLQDRRIEITGPAERKMIINALNSGSNVFMADFEDSITPTWMNMIDGQINLSDAVRRTISYTDPTSGKNYKLNEKTAVLLVRPRGWHLDEAHVEVDDQPMAGGIFDFGLFFFRNAKAQMAAGTGPYFYLPKMESHLEARLWNDIFTYAQKKLGIPHGTIRATVLIETIFAAFEMDEILYELRDHSAGLNAGRWDYIFSFIKKFSNDPKVILPDRGQVTMTTHFMRHYAKLLIRQCHRRNIHAMGGMSAFIPVKSDPEVNEKAMAQVRADKEREATDGHDGTWVAHPGLVGVAKEPFDRLMPQPNQIDKKHPEYQASAADLLKCPPGRHHRGRTHAEHRRRARLSRVLDSRYRMRAPVQPDGRRRHRRDQPRTALAVDPSRCPPEGRPQDRPQALRLDPERRAAESQSLGSAQALRRLSESREADAGAIRFADLHRVPDDSGLWLDPADGARRERDGDGGVAVYREFRLLRMAMQGAPCPAPLLGLRHGASSCSGRAREQSSPE